METCEFTDTCPFLNEEIINMPLSAHLLLESYCEGDLTMCTIHKLSLIHISEPRDGLLSIRRQRQMCIRDSTCPFLNEEIINMPLSAHLLLESYCKGDLTMCTIHK